jgi:uncharacterized protein (TIGR01244 family)
MLLGMACKSQKRWVRVAITALALPLLVALACYAKWTVLDHRLVAITPGRVYQSGAFAPDELVSVCRDLGIKTVIDLRNELPEAVALAAAASEAAGITHINLPTLSHPHLEEAEAFLEVMDKAEQPVLIHCQHGEGRSVMLCAIYRIQAEGWSNQQAFDGTARLPESLRFLNAWFPGLRRFRQTDAKGQFVLNYHRHEPKVASTPTAAEAALSK